MQQPGSGRGNESVASGLLAIAAELKLLQRDINDLRGDMVEIKLIQERLDYAIRGNGTVGLQEICRQHGKALGDLLAHIENLKRDLGTVRTTAENAASAANLKVADVGALATITQGKMALYGIGLTVAGGIVVKAMEFLSYLWKLNGKH